MKLYKDNNFVALERGGETILLPLGKSDFIRRGDYFILRDHVQGQETSHLWSNILDKDGSAQADADATEDYIEGAMGVSGTTAAETPESFPQTALFVVDDSLAPGSTDSSVKTALEGEGWTVTYVSNGDVTTAAASGYGVVLISDSIGAVSTTDDQFKDFAGGVVWVGRYATSGHEIGSGTQETGAQSTISVVNASHPITSVFSVGALTIYTLGVKLNRLDSAPADGVAIANHPSTGNPCLVAFEDGDTLNNSFTAPGRRVFTFISGTGGNRLTADGVTIIHRSMEWARKNI